MALSPGIPTSFVPKQPVQPGANRQMHSGNNVFLVASLLLAVVMCVIAGGVFAYDKFLTHTLATKEALLADAQAKVDQNTIEDFVRLRNRLSSSKDLLNSHIKISQFFDDLESVTLQNVRFSSMKLSVAGDNTAKLQMAGTAKTFNALAAQSNAFAADKHFKRAIFSGIGINDQKLVSFTLTADIGSELIVQNGAAQPAPANAAPTSQSVPVAPPSSAATVVSTSSPATTVTASTTKP